MIVPNYFEREADTPPSHQGGKLTENITEVDPLLLNVNDEDLKREIKDRLDSSESGTQLLRTKQTVGRDYYFGDQLKTFDLMHWQLPTVENRIFMSVEVLIPMITANPGDPDIHCLAEDPAQKEAVNNYIETVTSTLMYDYDVTYKLKDKVREVIRHWFMYYVGVLKARLDPMTNKPTFDVIDPRNMIFPSKNSPKGWKAEYKEDTLGDLLVMFPNAKAKLLEKYWKTGGKEVPESLLGTMIGYYEYWRPSFVAWLLEDDILDKRLNPNWDWDGEKRQTAEEAIIQPDGSVVIKPVVDTYKFRILDAPRDPYFIFNYFNVDGLDYDSTSFIEQGKPLQDLVNKRKRQITTMADDSGLLIASGAGGQGIKKKEFDKYDGSPRSTMWIPDGNPNLVFARLQGAQVNQGMILDLQDSRKALDNNFGTQDATRGENANPGESGVARMALRQGDISRVGPLAEAVEDFLQEIYMYDLQMRALFTNYDYQVPQVTSTDSGEYQTRVFNRNTIPFIKVDELITIDGKESMESYMKPVPITLRVRRNSTMPKDPLNEYKNAFELLQAGLIDPLTAMEKMGEVDPMGKLARLLKFKINPLALLSPEKQAGLQGLMPLMPPPGEETEATKKAPPPPQ